MTGSSKTRICTGMMYNWPLQSELTVEFLGLLMVGPNMENYLSLCEQCKAKSLISKYLVTLSLHTIVRHIKSPCTRTAFDSYDSIFLKLYLFRSRKVFLVPKLNSE